MNAFDAKRRLALAMLAAAAGQAGAADIFRNQTFKVICPAPPGGTADFVSRAFASELARATGSAFVVENMPGAGGVIATAAAAKSPPGGQVILMGTGGPLVVMPAMQPGKLPYDAQKDLSIVAVIAALKNVLVVRSDFPAANFREFIAHFKVPGRHLSYGSSGVGTAPHLAGELITKLTGIDAANVPYKGNVPAVADLMAGQIALAIVDYVSVAALVKEGRLRVIGVTSADRLSALPAVPSVAEQGLAGFDVKAWYGFFVPSGTSREVLSELNARFRAAAATPGFKERMVDAGIEPMLLDLDGSVKFWEREIRKWNELIPTLGIKI